MIKQNASGAELGPVLPDKSLAIGDPIRPGICQHVVKVPTGSNSEIDHVGDPLVRIRGAGTKNPAGEGGGFGNGSGTGIRAGIWNFGHFAQTLFSAPPGALGLCDAKGRVNSEDSCRGERKQRPLATMQVLD